MRRNGDPTPERGGRAKVLGDEPRPSAVVLVADADAGSRARFEALLTSSGYRVRAVADGQAVLDALSSEAVDVAVLDLGLPKVSGLNALAALPAAATDARVIVVAAEGTVESAVDAMKYGASDYLEKPVDGERLRAAVVRALDELSVSRASRFAEHAGRTGLGAMVGRTPAMRRVFGLIERVAPTRASVLVTGETGTGKDLVARAIHDASPRSQAPFIAVNCSAIPSTLLEAELFGHTRGSFTGAVQSRRGLIEEAEGGTLFLDEISTLSKDVQVKLLRVLQDRRVQRVGSNAGVAVDFRLVVATNTDLTRLVESGEFREDLLYRLDVFPIDVPPLRERKDDILPLAEHFLARMGTEHEVEPPQLSPTTLAAMMGYDWPGNVRELENFIERSVIMHPGARAFPFDLPRGGHARSETELVVRGVEECWSLDRLEREYLLATLEHNRWRRSVTAEVLGVNRRTIHRKLKRYREEGLLPDGAPDLDQRQRDAG